MAECIRREVRNRNRNSGSLWRATSLGPSGRHIQQITFSVKFDSLPSLIFESLRSLPDDATVVLGGRKDCVVLLSLPEDVVNEAVGIC